jgi:copper chaperone CopZ
MFYKFIAAVLVVTLGSASAIAQDYVINVNGIVCEFCSLGVTKKVSKLPFVDRAKYNKGVKVDIESQMVTVAVRDDATLDKAALFRAIESGGYNPVEIFSLTPDGERIAYRP